MNRSPLSRSSAALFSLLVVLMASTAAFGAASIVIQNNDAANVGFNDPTPLAPVGGNPGTTLGQQRLNAFQFAANIWGAILSSTPTITIRASWATLSCTADTAVLGATGAASIANDFPNAPFPGTLYSGALANALRGTDPFPSNPEINAQFNINLGNAGCLEGTHFYLGFDNNHGADVDLVSVLLHEFTHGFGFQTFTNTSTGFQMGGLPSIYDRFLFDDTAAKTWADMTNAERQASAINTGNLGWNGGQTIADGHTVLATPFVRVSSPAAIAGNYAVGTASFGPTLSVSRIAGSVVQALDPGDGAGPLTTDGCSLFTNSAAVSGKIAFIDRGTCTFVTKVKNAQNAGATGVIIADNAAGSPPPGLGGSDATITIPAVRITQADGNTIRAQLPGGVNAALLLDRSLPQGADPQGRPLVFTPNPLQSGSSVSHWDRTAFPNQLMEPDINDDLTHSVVPIQDLTVSLLRDIGWAANPIGDTQFFVRQHYLDFLNREPDSSGLAFWINDVTSCGLDQACNDAKHVNVSGAFFLSIEFKETGYLVYRLYKASFGNLPGAPVPVRFSDFLPDTQLIGQGVRVGIGDWVNQLEINKVAFTQAFVQRQAFLNAFPLSMNATDFVNKLDMNAGGVLSAAEKSQLVAVLNPSTDTAKRASVVRSVAENQNLSNAEFNKAFVLMQYFGYMRRNPNDAPDTDFTGYNFWLGKLNQFNGNFVDAEMVKAFIISSEYRRRFGS